VFSGVWQTMHTIEPYRDCDDIKKEILFDHSRRSAQFVIHVLR